MSGASSSDALAAWPTTAGAWVHRRPCSSRCKALKRRGGRRHRVERAVQVADVAGEQFGAAHRAAGFGLGFQHQHVPAGVGQQGSGDQSVVARADDDGVDVAAAASRGLPVLASFARCAPAARCIPDCAATPASCTVGNPPQRTRHGHLGHLDTAAAGDVGQRQGDSAAPAGTNLRQQNESFSGVQLSTTVSSLMTSGPGANRVQDGAPGPGQSALTARMRLVPTTQRE